MWSDSGVYVTISELGQDGVSFVTMGDATAGGVAVAETGSGAVCGRVSEDGSVYTNNTVL